MKHAGFNDWLDEQFARCKDVMVKKGDEYAHDDDRFHNFNRGAEITGRDPKQELMGFFDKHYISLWDLADGKLENTEEMSTEKVTDSLCYTLLMGYKLYCERKDV